MGCQSLRGPHVSSTSPLQRDSPCHTHRYGVWASSNSPESQIKFPHALRVVANHAILGPTDHILHGIESSQTTRQVPVPARRPATAPSSLRMSAFEPYSCSSSASRRGVVPGGHWAIGLTPGLHDLRRIGAAAEIVGVSVSLYFYFLHKSPWRDLLRISHAAEDIEIKPTVKQIGVCWLAAILRCLVCGGSFVVLAKRGRPASCSPATAARRSGRVARDLVSIRSRGSSAWHPHRYRVRPRLHEHRS